MDVRQLLSNNRFWAESLRARDPDFFARLASHWKQAYPGWTAWIAYPGLTLLGYGLAVVPAGDALIRVLTRAAGALCTGLGMVAIAALVLRGLGLLAVDGGTWTLWWVFACSLVLGPLGWLGAKLPRSS